MINVRFVAIPALLWGSTALAQAPMALDTACLFEMDSPASCSHAVACLDDETLFVGNAVGWESGTLTGALSTGAQCEGTWNNGETSAEFTCDDGQSGRVVYWNADEATGTAIGSGATETGRLIQSWSGPFVADYIAATTGARVLRCGAAELRF